MLIFTGLVWSASSQKCETVDEGLFISGGVAQVQHLNPNIDLSHPPLLRWVAGIPAVLFGDAQSHTEPPFVPEGAVQLRGNKLQKTFNWSTTVLYDEANQHDSVLFWGRSLFVLFGLLAGMMIFVELRHWTTPKVAFLALLGFMFIPEVLAHAQWAHSDLAAACLVLASALALARTLEEPSLKGDLILGATLGVAVLVKLTTGLVIPLAFALIAWFHPKEDGLPSYRGLLIRWLSVSLMIYVIIVLGYLPEPRLLPPHEFMDGEGNWLLRWLPLPDTLLKGLAYTKQLSEQGQIGFLMGDVQSKGWWYYFPIALVVKYPTPLLLLSAFGLVTTLRHTELTAARKAAWTLPPLVIMLAAMSQSINIGVRSILPIAPFMALWIGAGLMSLVTIARPFWSYTAHGLLTLSVLAGLSAYPNFLAYFNSIFGGTPAAHKWLADSNYDWGQDLPELKRTLDRRGIKSLRLAYFGSARPSFWNISAQKPDLPEEGWHAVSRSYLTSFWPPGDPYGWLRTLEPVELVGGSIALYHVTADDLPEGFHEIDAPQLMVGALDALRRKNPEAALEPLLSILSASPDHYGALYQLARTQQMIGNHRFASATWDVFITQAKDARDRKSLEYAHRQRALHPVTLPVVLSLKAGLSYLYEKDDPEAATIAFIKVLTQHPAHYAARYQLASALERQGLATAALIAWSRFLRLALTNGGLHTKDNEQYLEHARDRIRRLKLQSPRK